MLVWLVFLSPGMALLFRFAVPPITEVLDARLGFDLLPYYPLVMSFVGPTVSGIVGTVVGFLLLDQRDDRTLPALLVTPLSLNDYVAYRLALPMLVSLPLTLIMFPLAGLTDLTVAQVVASALSAVPLAPMYALFIGSFAANKVQGFALAKGIGVLFIPAVVAWFVAPPWQWLFGLNPLYWPLKVFWAFDAGDPWAWVYVIEGLACQSALLWLLARRFGHVMRR
jgi:fluoroquinolone transport system permease protein